MKTYSSSHDFSDPEFQNTFLLSLIAIIESIQLLAVIIWIFQGIPLSSPLTTTVLPEWRHLVQTEREIFFYWSFIIMAVALLTSLVYKFRRDMTSPQLRAGLLRFLSIESIMTLIIGITLFKGVVAHDSLLAKWVFYMATAAAFLIKIFWTSINNFMERFSLLQWMDTHAASFSKVCHVIIPVFIFFSIFICSREGVVAQIFTKDYFHHFDTFVASPVWAFTKKNILNIDTYTQYGFFMPIMVSALSRMVGGVSYENILLVLILMTICYMVLCYFFLQMWLKNIALSLLGIFLILKFQMFNSGTADPIIWRYPSGSAVRYFFDIPFFFLLGWHLKMRSPLSLLMTAILSGVAITYITDTGIYLGMAYYGYLIMAFVWSETRERIFQKYSLWLNLLYFILPILSMLLIYGIFAGGHIFEYRFWYNSTDFIRLSKGGWGALPISSFIEQGKLLNVLMAGGMCLLYVLTIAVIGSLSYRRKMDYKNLLPVVIAIYGLGLFHYYIGRSSADNVPIICIPAILLLCYWLNLFAPQIHPVMARRLGLVFSLSAFIALLSTQAFSAYPNCLHSSKNFFAQQIKNMQQDFVSVRDIDLIKQLTEPDEKVWLISDLETSILMKANRRPSLYYLPFIFSHSFKIKQFGGNALFTQERLRKILADFEKQRPSYVFIEKQFLDGLPQIYYVKFESLTVLVTYLYEHYQIFQSGDYLLVLKHKD